jgi:hypothetical protein
MIRRVEQMTSIDGEIFESMCGTVLGLSCQIEQFFAQIGILWTAIVIALAFSILGWIMMHFNPCGDMI